jgi:thiol-disulfide isomerase/thioredoxin
MKLATKSKRVLIVSFCIFYFHSLAYSNSPIESFPKRVHRNRTFDAKTAQDTILLDYPFKDTKNQTVRLSDFKGKFIFVDMWYSGCGFCISANEALYAVHEKLKNENIVFLSISVDSIRQKWITSITKNAPKTSLNPWAGKYNPSPGTIILYTGGSGLNNDFVKKYDPDNYYPKLLLIDPSGKLISDHPPRPDGIPDQPEKLIDFIMGFIKK